MQAEDIVKLMDENDITIHDIAKCLNIDIWIWGLSDFISELRERNEIYGEEMSEEEVSEISKRAFEKFEICNCSETLYEIVFESIRNLLGDEIDLYKSELNFNNESGDS